MANPNYPYNLINLSQANDPLLTNAFSLLIPIVPGSASSDILFLRLLTVDGPFDFEVGDTDIFTARFRYNFAGALRPKQDLTVTYQENANGSVLNVLQAWQQQTVDYNSGLNTSKATYATTAFMNIIGANQNTAMQIQFNNFWLKKITPPAFENSNEKNDVLKYTVVFKYDFVSFPIATFSTI